MEAIHETPYQICSDNGFDFVLKVSRNKRLRCINEGIVAWLLLPGQAGESFKKRDQVGHV